MPSRSLRLVACRPGGRNSTSGCGVQKPPPSLMSEFGRRLPGQAFRRPRSARAIRHQQATPGIGICGPSPGQGSRYTIRGSPERCMAGRAATRFRKRCRFAYEGCRGGSAPPGTGGAGCRVQGAGQDAASSTGTQPPVSEPTIRPRDTTPMHGPARGRDLAAYPGPVRRECSTPGRHAVSGAGSRPGSERRPSSAHAAARDGSAPGGPWSDTRSDDAIRRQGDIREP